MVTLYDHRGRPVRPAELTRELAAPSVASVRSIWREPEADGLTPTRLGTILRNAAQGDADAYLTLAEEMEERDWHYSSVLRTRKLAVAGLPVAVEAGSDSPDDARIADEVRALTQAPEFPDLVADLLDGIGKGYAVAEILWQRSSSSWRPRYEWRDPRFFCFDRDSGRELRLRDVGAPDGVALPPYKFIVHTPRLKSGIALRGGLARLASAAYMCKSFAVKDWLAFAEVFGMPIRVGRYGSSATEQDIQKLISAVANIGTDAAAVLHESMKLELEAAPTGAGGAELFRGLAEWLDKQVSKAVLGQTMTTEDGSSYAQAGVHNEVRGDLVRADARQLSASLNRDLVRPFVDLNFGARAAYPRIAVYVEEAEDLKALAESLPPFIDRGARVSMRAILDRFGLAEPKEGEEILGPVNAREAQPAMQRARMRQEEARLLEDELVEEMLADWRPAMEPVLAPIEDAVRRATSFEDLQRELDRTADAVDSNRLIRELAIAMFKARGVGDARDEP